ncbi:MAG: HD domain-containing protein [Candidatus Altarchaeaceae archaeon]
MDVLKFIEKYKILKNIPRSGWLSCGVKLNEVENVFDHTLDVTLISMLLIDIFRKENFKVDGEKTLRIALIHDIEESILTDIPYPCKKYLKNLKEAKEEVVKEIFKECFENSEFYINLWKEKNNNSIEGEIVHIADLLSMIYEHYEIRKRFKTKELDEHLKNCMDDLKPFIEKYKFIEKILPKF